MRFAACILSSLVLYRRYNIEQPDLLETLQTSLTVRSALAYVDFQVHSSETAGSNEHSSVDKPLSVLLALGLRISRESTEYSMSKVSEDGKLCLVRRIFRLTSFMNVTSNLRNDQQYLLKLYLAFNCIMR